METKSQKKRDKNPPVDILLINKAKEFRDECAAKYSTFFSSGFGVFFFLFLFLWSVSVLLRSIDFSLSSLPFSLLKHDTGARKQVFTQSLHSFTFFSLRDFFKILMRTSNDIKSDFKNRI